MGTSGKGTRRGQEGREKGVELKAKKQQDAVGMQVLFHRLRPRSSSSAPTLPRPPCLTGIQAFWGLSGTSIQVQRPACLCAHVRGEKPSSMKALFSRRQRKQPPNFFPEILILPRVVSSRGSTVEGHGIW